MGVGEIGDAGKFIRENWDGGSELVLPYLDLYTLFCEVFFPSLIQNLCRLSSWISSNFSLAPWPFLSLVFPSFSPSSCFAYRTIWLPWRCVLLFCCYYYCHFAFYRCVVVVGQIGWLMGDFAAVSAVSAIRYFCTFCLLLRFKGKTSFQLFFTRYY